MNAICTDLAAETDALGELLASLSADEWKAQTPAEGWSVADTVSHIAFYDEMATLALTDPDAFTASLDGQLAKLAEGDPSVEAGRILSGDELLDLFDSARSNLIAALSEVDAKDRIVWYGPAMGAISFATARLMETWAHGQDIFDALDLVSEPTERIKHIAHIGVRAMSYAFMVNGLEPPGQAVRVELSGPNGENWEWGDQGADNAISGPAVDFALLVTQRRHRDDLSLVVEGVVANQWVDIAQAFAGPAGTGREPLGSA